MTISSGVTSSARAAAARLAGVNAPRVITPSFTCRGPAISLPIPAIPPRLIDSRRSLTSLNDPLRCLSFLISSASTSRTSASYVGSRITAVSCSTRAPRNSDASTNCPVLVCVRANKAPSIPIAAPMPAE